MKTIPLSQGKFAILDDEHYDYLNQWKWHTHNSRGKLYAARWGYWSINDTERKTRVMMHREIAGITGLQVDHINGDSLDNRSENLRPATMSQNQMNQKIHQASRSGFKGVRETSADRFQARITINGKYLCIGTFPTKTDAALAYNKAATELFGDRACLNQIMSEVG